MSGFFVQDIISISCVHALLWTKWNPDWNLVLTVTLCCCVDIITWLIWCFQVLLHFCVIDWELLATVYFSLNKRPKVFMGEVFLVNETSPYTVTVCSKSAWFGLSTSNLLWHKPTGWNGSAEDELHTLGHVATIWPAYLPLYPELQLTPSVQLTQLFQRSIPYVQPFLNLLERAPTMIKIGVIANSNTQI